MSPWDSLLSEFTLKIETWAVVQLCYAGPTPKSHHWVDMSRPLRWLSWTRGTGVWSPGETQLLKFALVTEMWKASTKGWIAQLTKVGEDHGAERTTTCSTTRFVETILLNKKHKSISQLSIVQDNKGTPVIHLPVHCLTRTWASEWIHFQIDLKDQ